MKKLFILLLTIPSFVSCVMYHPHNSDIPLLEEKGDVHIDASASMTLPFIDGTGINASVAWAPFNMVGVQASGSISDDNNYHVQGAIGTYQHLGGRAILECYAGAALGHSYYSGSNGNFTVGGPYSTCFGQVNFGWNHLANGHIDLGIGLKGGALNPSWDRLNYNGETESWNKVDSLGTSMFLLEPQFVFRAGGEHLQFSLNMAYSLIPGWPTENNNFNCTRFSIGMGVHLKF